MLNSHFPFFSKFHLGPWGGCSALCGKGVRKRDVTCFQKNLSNGTIEVLEEDNCTQEKPEIEEECEAENPCGSVDWLVTDWSGCPETCGKF